MRKQGYEELKHDLDTKMLQAHSLGTEPERKSFVDRTFTSIHTAYQGKQVSHADYLKLVNRLASFKQGEYNDYLDILVGAAAMGMLELATQGDVPQLSPEQARQRSREITGMTGVEPVDPEKE